MRHRTARMTAMMSLRIARPSTMMSPRTARVTALLLVIATPIFAGSHRTLTGFTRAGSAAELRIEAELAGQLDTGRVDRDFRELTREPHTAGTPRNNDLARYVADSLTAAGLEDVTQIPYDVLMSYPKSISVEMTAPRLHTAN